MLFLHLLCVRIQIDQLVRELLSNISLFVGQLCKVKSLALRARDLIFFTTDLQTVNYYNNSLLELIYFLNTLQNTITLEVNNMNPDPY